jgi:hypothetical protein
VLGSDREPTINTILGGLLGGRSIRTTDVEVSVGPLSSGVAGQTSCHMSIHSKTPLGTSSQVDTLVEISSTM